MIQSKKNILIYYPYNKRTISIESVTIKFKEQGHQVLLLSQVEKGDLHKEIELNDIETFSYVVKNKNGLLFYLKHMFFLIKFCRTYKINIIYSHAQPANIVAVFAQYFCNAKFYTCRHHSSVSGLEYNFNQTLFDKVINFFAKTIIVPSSMVYKQVCDIEKVNPKKVKLIYYGYNFDKYPKPNIDEVKNIRKQHTCKLLLVKVARLVTGKRYPLLFEVIKKMKEEGKDVKLLVLGDGPLFTELKTYIEQNNLQKTVFLLGNVTNVIDYLAASDAVPMLSEAEASNSVIKEAGLVKKCVLVCKQVGDFEDYIVHNENGLLLSRDEPQEELYRYLNSLYFNEIDKDKLGNNLYQSVFSNFSIEEVIGQYELLNL